MSKYVPLEKRSKKEQKAFHAVQRGSWNGVNPVSRKTESKKAYKRSRMKQAERQFRKDERPACFSVLSQAITDCIQWIFRRLNGQKIRIFCAFFYKNLRAFL